MPEGTPLAKELATLEYGAEAISYGTNYDEAVTYATALARENGLLYVSAFDHELIMAGQGGTIGLELLEDLPDINTLLVPIGGVVV